MIRVYPDGSFTFYSTFNKEALETLRPKAFYAQGDWTERRDLVKEFAAVMSEELLLDIEALVKMETEK